MTLEQQVDEKPMPAGSGEATESALADGLGDDGIEPGVKLEPRQRMLLAALVRDPDVQAAAAAAGVCRATAHRWLRLPVFKEELARQRDVVVSAALAGIQAQATRAAVELGRLLDEEDGRLRRLVCNDILTHAMRMREMDVFESRLSVLEAELERHNKETK
jgi:hypothetical protein